jgi:hypothetical protein
VLEFHGFLLVLDVSQKLLLHQHFASDCCFFIRLGRDVNPWRLRKEGKARLQGLHQVVFDLVEIGHLSLDKAVSRLRFAHGIQQAILLI